MANRDDFYVFLVYLQLENELEKNLDPCFYAAFSGGTVVNKLSASAGEAGDVFNPWIGRIPWKRKWQPTPVSFPGKFHGQRSLAGYSPWGH